MEKRILALIAIVAILFSCEHAAKMEKPFVVVQKFPNAGYAGFTRYYYQDRDGREYAFDEKFDKYNIGDTIR